MTGREPLAAVRDAALSPVAPPIAIEKGDSETAAAIQALAGRGDLPAARELFSGIVTRHQRRAARIAFSYLRDAAEADEAVQDAFVRAFSRIASFRPELSFEVWLTRILINGCLDRRKARMRRERWLVPFVDAGSRLKSIVAHAAVPAPSPEALAISREQRRRIAAALDRLPDRQRAVFVLCECSGHSTSEVAEILSVSESTVRVHLFRAVRKLRRLLRDTR